MARVLPNWLYDIVMASWKAALANANTIDQKSTIRAIIKKLENTPIYRVGMRLDEN